MKVFRVEQNNIVRISFGSKSMSFTETTVAEVYDIFLQVFDGYNINETIVLKNHSVFEKPSTLLNFVVNVREEGGGLKSKYYKGGSKSKTMYGITKEKALNVFAKHYHKYLKDN